jgi:osmoprotectant transport system substrate-binding protein
MRTSRFRFLAALVAVGFVLAACGKSNSNNSSSTTTAAPAAITIGSFGFTESEILADIYGKALENAGVKVTYKLKLGSREVVAPALDKGEIDVVPEYVGNLLAFYNKDANLPGDDLAATTAKLRTEAKAKKVTVLEPSMATDGDIIAMTKAKATSLSAMKISDLKGKDSTLVMGGPAECQGRITCLKGLQDVYGLKFKEFKALDTGGPLTVTALKDGTIQLARLFSSDPAIKKNDFLVLEDDKHIQPPGNVVPVARDAAINDAITKVLNKVSAALTTDDLISLNDAVSGDQKKDAKTVAVDWVTAHVK